MVKRCQTVIVVSEGDASGNTKLLDIEPFLREKIGAFFKAEKIPIVMRYFDPNYIVRSSPANLGGSIL
jgi:6-phosphofructokinase 1